MLAPLGPSGPFKRPEIGRKQTRAKFPLSYRNQRTKVKYYGNTKIRLLLQNLNVGPFRTKIDWKVDLRKEFFPFIENSVQKYYDNMEIRLLLQNLSFDSFRPFGPLKWTIDRKIDLRKISSLLSKSASKNSSVT